MWRPVQVAFGRSGVLRYSDTTMVLRRRADAGPFDYTVWSVPFELKPDSPSARTPVKYDNPRLHALASMILTQAGVEPDPAKRLLEDEGRAARAIQDYLRGNLGYTLEQEEPPKDVEPVEHFLFDRKIGHCEYFASAMVLLCRSVGINARMVTGYVATEYSASTGSYTVRESNAHAWVEAEEDQRRWKRYDPTPPADLIRIHKPAIGILGKLRQAVEAVEYAWNTSIVAFNERTRQSIFGPTRGEQSGWLGTVERFSQRVRGGGARLMMTAVINGVVVFVAVAAGGFALSFILRRVFGLGSSRAKGVRVAVFRDRIGFYRSLLRALSRRGLMKPAWLPPLAHAQALGEVDAALAADVQFVVDEYYEQRFAGGGVGNSDKSGRSPDRERRRRVDAALDRIRRFRPGRPPEGRSGGL